MHVANARPMIVFLYKNNGVQVTESVDINTPPPIIGSEKPLATYRVYATSLVGAVRAALMAAYGEAHPMPETIGQTEAASVPDSEPQGYRLALGESTDLTLNRLATEAGTDVSEVLRRAVNLYATVKSNSDDGYVYVKRRAHPNAQLSVRKIAVP